MQKVIITAENTLPNLYDVCKGISAVIFVEDALHFEFQDIFGSEPEDFGDEGIIDYKLTRDDVSKFLRDFRTCKSIVLAARRRTLITEKLGLGPITEDDLMNIVKHLTVEDYVKCVPNSNPEHKDTKLIVFISNKEFELQNGNTLSGVKVYIKINLDESNEKAMLAVSFHTTKSYGKHPYA